MAGIDILKEWAAYLESKSVGTADTDLFMNAMPDLDVVTVGVFEVPSQSPHLLQSTSYIRRPRLRLDFRSTAPAAGDYPDITNARNRAQLAYQACLDVAGTTMPSSTSESGYWILAIPQSEPYLSARDDKNRSTFTFSVDCERQSG